MYLELYTKVLSTLLCSIIAGKIIVYQFTEVLCPYFFHSFGVVRSRLTL